MLPSVEAMSKTMKSKGLFIKNKKMFGDDYADHKIWTESFEILGKVLRLKGLTRALRDQKYYLGYCEGGFKSGNINVGQFLKRNLIWFHFEKFLLRLSSFCFFNTYFPVMIMLPALEEVHRFEIASVGVLIFFF